VVIMDSFRLSACRLRSVSLSLSCDEKLRDTHHHSHISSLRLSPFCATTIALLKRDMVRSSTFALSFQIACVFDSLRLSEFLSLSASIAFFGTFAISPGLIAFVAFRFDIFSFISCSCVSPSSDFSGIRRPHLPFVFAFALIRLRHLQLHALTFDASDTLRFLSFLSTTAASFRIVPLRQPELQFIPIAFRISDFVSLRIVASGPRRCSFAFDLFACLSLAFDPSSWSSFPSTSAAYFRVVAFRFAFDLFGYVHSPSMSLALFH
jgi:hypothetical protein